MPSIDSVYDTYNINLTNENFLIRFAFHLKNLLLRLQYNIKITNIQFSTIKNDYPLIYAISVYIAKIITQSCGYVLPEDEISYICLHVGVLMDEKKLLMVRLNLLLYVLIIISLVRRYLASYKKLVMMIY